MLGNLRSRPGRRECIMRLSMKNLGSRPFDRIRNRCCGVSTSSVHHTYKIVIDEDRRVLSLHLHNVGLRWPRRFSIFPFPTLLPPTILTLQIVLAIDQFRTDYGTPYNGSFVIPVIWQLGFGGGSLFGLLFGGLSAGYFSKRWGRQLCMFISYGTSPLFFPTPIPCFPTLMQISDGISILHHRRLPPMVFQSREPPPLPRR